jgi:hypothetical protein
VFDYFRSSISVCHRFHVHRFRNFQAAWHILSATTLTIIEYLPGDFNREIKITPREEKLMAVLTVETPHWIWIGETEHRYWFSYYILWNMGMPKSRLLP